MPKEEHFKATLESDPGNPVFADFAAQLISQERLNEAILLCMRGLSSNPECHKGRLLLAHALFRNGFIPFAAQQVDYLRKYFPNSESLTSLYSRLSPSAQVSTVAPGDNAQVEEVADAEFDVDVLEEIEE